jgi:plastocyanin
MRTTFFRRAVAVSLGVGTLMWGIASEFTVAQAQEPNAVVIKNFMFSPMSLTVKAGSTVTWKNLDGEPHAVATMPACSTPARSIRTTLFSSSSINPVSTRYSAAFTRI